MMKYFYVILLCSIGVINNSSAYYFGKVSANIDDVINRYEVLENTLDLYYNGSNDVSWWNNDFNYTGGILNQEQTVNDEWANGIMPVVGDVSQILSSGTATYGDLIKEMKLHNEYDDYLDSFNGGKSIYLGFHFQHTEQGVAPSAVYIVVVEVRHCASVSINNGELCTEREYSFSEIFSGTKSFMQMESISSNINFSFNPSTLKYTFENVVSGSGSGYVGYNCEIDGYEVEVRFEVSFDQLKEAHFTGTIQEDGFITVNSSSVNMEDYIFSNGGIVECFGDGVIANGNDYWFNPNYASFNGSLVHVRTKNGGCYSKWHDTVFVVTPIVTSINTPVIDYVSTFPNGVLNLYKNVGNGFEQSSKFHFACANSDYSIKMDAPSIPGVHYEYLVLFHGDSIDGGVFSNDEFEIQTPENYNVEVGKSGNINGDWGSQISLDNSLTDYMVQFLGDWDQDGGLDGMGISTYLGDLLTIKVKTVNVFGLSSNWTDITLGVVKNPVLSSNVVKCYNDNPTMSDESLTPVYSPHVDRSIYRSAKYDIDLDGDFDIDGSNDNYTFNMFTYQKMDRFISQVVDSTYLSFLVLDNNQYYHRYTPAYGEVCVSNIDTVLVVRKPEFTPSFSDTGVIEVGGFVQSHIDGDWYNSDLDTVKWRWNDGSPLYYGDTNYHFFNDLMFYDLNIEVVDRYGCSEEVVFNDYWIVEGTLNVSELYSTKEEYNVYPNPVQRDLFLDFDDDNYKIFNVNGKLVYSGDSDIVDVSSFMNGVYFVVFEKTNIVKKIIKL